MAAQGSKNKATVFQSQPDGWTTREKLILSCSVLRSGDQNWVSVSRTIRPICEAVQPRSTEFFSQKNCAQKYADLLESVDTPKRKRTSNEPGGTETPQEQILRRLTFERIEELKLSVKKDHEQHRLLKQDIEAIRSGKVDSDLKKIWEDIQSGKKIPIGQLMKDVTPEKSPLASQASQSQTPTLHRSRHQRVTKTTPKFQTYKEQLKQQQARYHHQHPAQHHTQQHQTQQHQTQQHQQHQAQHQVQQQQAPLSQIMQGQQVQSVPHHHQQQTKHDDKQSQPLKQEAKHLQQQASSSLHLDKQTEKQQPAKVTIESESVAVDPTTATVAPPVVYMAPKQKVENVQTDKPDKEINVVIENIPPKPTNICPEKIKLPTENKNIDVGKTEHMKVEDSSISAPSKVETLKPSINIKEEKIAEEDVLSVDEEYLDEKTSKIENIVNEPSKSKEIQDSNAEITPIDNVTTDHPIDANEADHSPSEDIEDDSHNLTEECGKEETVEVDEDVCKDDSQIKDAEAADSDDVVCVDMSTEEPKSSNEDSRQPIRIVSDDETTNQNEDSLDQSSLRMDDTRSDVDSNSVVDVTETQSTPSPTPKRKSRGRHSRHGKRKTSATSKLEEICDESVGSIDELASEKDDGESEQASVHDPKDFQDEDSNDDDSRCTETDGKPTDRESDISRLHAVLASPASPALSTGSNCDPETAQAQKTWRKSIMLVWKAAASHRYANVFLHPVTNDEAPGYHDVIYRPMDLQTIKKNIETGGIRTTSEFQRDMMLMFQNAIMYNNSDHDVFRMAQEMRDDVMEQIQSYIATQLMMQSSDRDSKTLRGHKSEGVAGRK